MCSIFVKSENKSIKENRTQTQYFVSDNQQRANIFKKVA